MSRRIHLVVVDPQNSFCRRVDPRQQQAIHDGELCIPGAWEDMQRVAAMIRRLSSQIDRIDVTLDCHQLFHIAHPIWFRDGGGRHPEPFTIMRQQGGVILGSRPNAKGDYHEVGKFTTTRPDFLGRTVDYLEQLAAGNRHPHCIWPPHCLVGTPGQNIVASLMEALLEWCRDNSRCVHMTMKGSNPFVEHFSAVRAEVPDRDDPKTHLNTTLIDRWSEADEILLAGEAGSHCLAHTVRDVAEELPDEVFAKKCVLLTDGTSPVPGFESFQQDFIDQMAARGMRTATCADYLA